MVLIILAVISINLVFNDDGIINRAEKAKDHQTNAEASDLERTEILANEIASRANGNGGTGGDTNPEAGTEVNKPSDWTSTQITPIADGKGGTVPLPDGFYYIGGNYDDGLVISDKQGDTMDASGTTSGNQFVWIPVSNEADLERTEFDSNGQPTTGLDTTKYTEPYASGYPTEASEYNTMKTQVLKYGGFYIGRYEAGVNSTTLRTAVTEAQTVVSKKGVAPYNYVPWGKSMSDIGNSASPSGAVYLAKNLATQEGYTSVTSTLCYSSQWDAMCRYIGDANRTTPEKTAPELTGSVSTDVSKNIYDLAGNCSEWTMEAYYTGDRVKRGGYCNYDFPVSIRVNYGPDDDYYSFRCGLYIK